MRLTISKEEAAVLISALDYEFEAMRDREASMGNPPRVWVEKMSTNRAIVDMLDQGINIAPSQYEAGFMSVAHSQEDLDKTIEAASTAFRAL